MCGAAMSIFDSHISSKILQLHADERLQLGTVQLLSLLLVADIICIQLITFKELDIGFVSRCGNKWKRSITRLRNLAKCRQTRKDVPRETASSIRRALVLLHMRFVITQYNCRGLTVIVLVYSRYGPISAIIIVVDSGQVVAVVC